MEYFTYQEDIRGVGSYIKSITFFFQKISFGLCIKCDYHIKLIHSIKTKHTAQSSNMSRIAIYLTLNLLLQNIFQVEPDQVFASKIMKANPCLSLSCNIIHRRTVSLVRKKANLSRKPKEALFWEQCYICQAKQT